MRIAGVIVAGLLFVLSLWPAVGLWKIVWEDRKLPRSHPDYSGLYGGKRLVAVAALCCTLVALACLVLIWILAVYWSLK